jgi:hypothetical protein
VAEQGWTLIEYEEIHKYGRTVYETIFRLMQATFVINPALAVGYYYIYFDKPNIPLEVAFAGFGVALLGVVYNYGASRVYRSSHKFLERLLIRMKEIDDREGLKTYEAVQLTAPPSYVDYWKKSQTGYSVKGDWARYLSADRLTWLFLMFLMTAWAAGVLIAIFQILRHI